MSLILVVVSVAKPTFGCRVTFIAQPVDNR